MISAFASESPTRSGRSRSSRSVGRLSKSLTKDCNSVNVLASIAFITIDEVGTFTSLCVAMDIIFSRCFRLNLRRVGNRRSNIRASCAPYHRGWKDGTRRRHRLVPISSRYDPRPQLQEPHSMTMTPEQRKADLVDRLASEARKRVADAQAESAEAFVRRYFALVAPDDIIYSAFETLLGGALSLWQFGEQRNVGAPKVRLFNPAVEGNGWGLEHTVVEIVNDDMPFLVDSVSAEVSRLGRNIHLLLHPVVRVRRDAGGRRAELTSTQEATIDAI